MAKVKVFWKKVKRQGHKVNFFFCNGNVLSQGMYIYKSPTSSGEETMAKVEVF